MMQVKTAIQFRPNKDDKAVGIVWHPARRVTSSSRGISYEEPAGFFVQTHMGNLRICDGDWLLVCGSGNIYVVKQWDYWDRATSWSSFWRRVFK